jgi:hypothetical protein
MAELSAAGEFPLSLIVRYRRQTLRTEIESPAVLPLRQK